MNREQIIKYLKTPNRSESIIDSLTDIGDKVLKLQEQLEVMKNNYIYSSQVKSSSLPKVKVLTSDTQDLGNVLEKTINYMKVQEKELLMLENSYIQELEDQHRLFLIIRTFEFEDQKIIKLKFEQNLPTKVLEVEFNKDHKTMHKKIYELVDEITRLFNSNLSNADFCDKRVVEDKRMEFKEKEKRAKASENQLQLSDFL